MQLLQDGVVAALAAIGLTTLIFLLVSAVTCPRRRGTINTITLVPVRGEDGRLELTVRALVRAREAEGSASHIVIVDQGMGAETARIAAILCREERNVTLCGAEELSKLLTREK